MNKDIKKIFKVDQEYQNFFKEPNINLIKILYSEENKLNYSILREDHKIIKINNKIRRFEFIQIFYFLELSKSGYFTPAKIIQIYKNFPDYIDYLLEKNKNKERQNFENKIISLINDLNNLNDKISSIIYLIDSKFILKNLDLLKVKFKKTSLNEKIINIANENEKIKTEKNIFLRNSKIINKLSLREKILILKFLWDKDYLNLNNDLSERNFISKEKIEERKNILEKNIQIF